MTGQPAWLEARQELLACDGFYSFAWEHAGHWYLIASQSPEWLDRERYKVWHETSVGHWYPARQAQQAEARRAEQREARGDE